MTGFEKKLAWAGRLIAGGLVVQIATTVFVHPLAFVAFLLIACPLVVSGILLFLWAVASAA